MLKIGVFRAYIAYLRSFNFLNEKPEFSYDSFLQKIIVYEYVVLD